MEPKHEVTPHEVDVVTKWYVRDAYGYSETEFFELEHELDGLGNHRLKVTLDDKWFVSEWAVYQHPVDLPIARDRSTLEWSRAEGEALFSFEGRTEYFGEESVSLRILGDRA